MFVLLISIVIAHDSIADISSACFRFFNTYRKFCELIVREFPSKSAKGDMSDNTTNFPPQTYSSSFYINALVEGESKLTCVNSELSGDEEERKTTGLDCFISTMKCYLVIAILSNLIHFTVQQRHPDILDCIQDNRTRTFDSLVHYQGTNISFDPKHPGYLGNNVNFSFVSIDRLSKNSFVSFGSNSVIKISLDHKNISRIDDGAFLELTCLHDLDLSHNALSELSSGVFEGLHNLARLNFSGNLLRDIPHMLGLDHLTFLDASRNLISITSSFPLPMTLVLLNLGFNRVRALKNTTLANLSSLKFLELNDNNLADVDPGTWEELYYIEDLNLARNSLRSFNTTYNIHLKKLNLSGNHLSTFQVRDMRKNFAALRLLDITKNDWYCEDLDVIRHHLKDSNVVLQEPIDCRTVTTVSPVISTTKKEFDLIMDIVAQNGEILASNKELEKHVTYVENVLVYLFIIIVIYIIINVSVKTGLCKNLYARFLERDGAYLDNAESEVLVMR